MLEIAPGIKGYLVRPKASGTYPVVFVIHENRGLNPHIKDVTRRVAKEGFIAFGGDFLTSKGGTPADEDKARELIGTLSPQETVGFAQSPLMRWRSWRVAMARWAPSASAGVGEPSTLSPSRVTRI